MKLSGRIVFSSGKTGDFDIWTLNLDTGEMRQLTHGVACNESPRWSPDGKSIAYISNVNGVPQIWIMRDDGSNQRCITPAQKFHADPNWSPDGKTIAFVGNYEDNPNEVEIYQIAADGSGKPEQLISYPGWEAGPTWSPDGKSIVFSSTRAGSEDIWEYTLATKAWRQITSHPARDYAPCYSPDGKWIAFISEADERSAKDKSADGDVWIVSRDLSQEKCLTKNSLADRYVAWSPDSRFIICCSSGHLRMRYRFRIIDTQNAKTVDFAYDRSLLEQEIGAEMPQGTLAVVVLKALANVGDTVMEGAHLAAKDKHVLQSSLKDFYYPGNFFGTEQSPHWTK